MSAAATTAEPKSTPATGTTPGFAIQSPVQPKHKSALTGRQVAVKFGVSTGTVRRARRKLELTNSGAGYSPAEVTKIGKLLAKQAEKSSKAAPKAEKSAPKRTAAQAASASAEKPQG